MSTTSAAQNGEALSRAQLQSALWIDKRLHVYALLMGSRIAGIAERLASADVADWHCLVPGALTPAQAAAAPYQVELRRASSFTDWLLFEASAGFGEWGVLALSSARGLQMRGHARALCQAVAPDGRILRIDWMDPALLRLLLPLADPGQLTQVFGQIDTLVVPGSREWQFHRLELGMLSQRSCAMLGAA